MIADLQYGVRTLARSPGFTALAVLSLALGLGVTSAVFGLIDAVLLRPVPAPDSDQLVSVYHRSRSSGQITATSYPAYEHHRNHSKSLSGLMAFLRYPTAVRIDESVAVTPVELVSRNYFSVLRISAEHGRTFGPAERQTVDRDAVAVISHHFLTNRFGGDPAAVGSVIYVNRVPFTVIGVAPKGFRGTRLDWIEPPELWIPLSMRKQATPMFSEERDPVRQPAWQIFEVVGRLRHGVDLEHARAELEVLHEDYLRETPQAPVDWDVYLHLTNKARIWVARRGSAVTYLTALMAVVGLVLLIACFNVANLLLTRGARRQQEIAVRAAIGAGRWRIARQLLAESGLIAVLGGVAGVGVATVAISLINSFALPFGAARAVLDGRVLAFNAALAPLTVLVFGLAPVRQAIRLDLVRALKGSAGGRTQSARRLRGGILVAQVALSVVLLAGAALFAQTVVNVQQIGTNVDLRRTLTVAPPTMAQGYTPETAQRFYRDLLRRTRSVPGVEAAGLVRNKPLSRGHSQAEIVPRGLTVESRRRVRLNTISPGYFETVGLRILRGRDFSERDEAKSPMVAILNVELANELWPGENPLGRRFRMVSPPVEVEVVGVVRDPIMRGLREGPVTTLYVPFFQHPRPGMRLQVRAATNPAPVIAALRELIRELDREMPAGAARTMQKDLEAEAGQERLAAGLLGGLAALGLVLTAIGVYGLTSFEAAQRTREIGIRVALGASEGNVIGGMLRRSLTLVVGGVVLGTGVALGLGRLAESLLFGVSSSDPGTMGAAIVILVGTAAVAAYLPARRAAKMDPLVALRYE